MAQYCLSSNPPEEIEPDSIEWTQSLFLDKSPIANYIYTLRKIQNF
jgi:hypothetical protein